MPTYETDGPISATLEFEIGTVWIRAGKRTDTVVEVRPANAAREADVKAAELTQVDFAGGRLTLKGPKQRTVFSNKKGSIEVLVELPSGSEVHADSPMADFVTEGPLGDCRLKASMGRIQIDRAEGVRLKTDHGDIRVGAVSGDAEVSGAGRIEVGSVGGRLTVKNSNGDTEIDEVYGELTANASNGRIHVGLAEAGVDAKTANGHIRLGRVVRGKVVVQSGVGDVEVGIAEGTAAWLDVHSKFGTVRNTLGAAEGPGDARETVEVRGRTQVGSIIVRRA
ncbi:DUF4097 family beta strand repeat-containing protein [Streptomyces sp. CB01881]|uniref:DUF4097 family beta strand repeat-containing protein n=1 Tax=Streptomyces sp. CB01881 TaxID=2078691 RepID=UPI000CDC692E|nr:DUF4097 family beta strand repeat-containing protein [Streptomyces sp. CB01881]AUY51618.1 hypothetical protein C2142_24795 [Streptomyces sp. CB01881]TYC71053.1 hypothetical protein EH183_24785 [Streptomyces sp. CB01881]